MTSNVRSARIAVIAGASGLVEVNASNYSYNLLTDDQVIAFVRRPLENSDAKLRQVIVDFSCLPPLREFAGADVFSALGTTMKIAGSRDAFRRVDFDAALAFATAAAQGGARQFTVVSSIGADVHRASFI